MKLISLLILGIGLSYFHTNSLRAAELLNTDNYNYLQFKPNSSESNRIDKSFSLLVQPVGIGPSPGLTTGLILAYFFNANNQISLNYSKYHHISTEFDLFNTGGKSPDISLEGDSIGIHYKRFMSNTFYILMGIDHRYFKYSYKSGCSTFLYNNCKNDEYLTNRTLIDFEGSSQVMTFAIGNQWQFKHFTLGCDWGGIAVPLSHQYLKLNYQNMNSSGQEALDKQKIEQFYNPSIIALRFYLGASF